MAIQKISSKVPKDVRTQRAFDSSVLTVVEGKLSPFQGMPTLRGFNYLMLDPSEKITSGREGGPVGSNGYFEKGTLGWSNQAPDNSIESFATSIRSAGGKVDMTKRAADLVKLRAGLANKEKTSFTDDSGNVFIILDNGGTLSLYHQDIQTAHVDIVNSALSNLFAKSDKKELVCGLCAFSNIHAGTVYLFAGKLGVSENKWELDGFNASHLKSDADSFALVVGVGNGIARYANATANFLSEMGIPNVFASSNKTWGKKARATPDDIYNRMKEEASRLYRELYELRETNLELSRKIYDSPAPTVSKLAEKIEKTVLPKFNKQRKVHRELAGLLHEISEHLSRIGDGRA